ncbi:unknown [Proteobacteria bacterium CAG:495]|nr:unknown [Proteobacteria bacterium CAG:495]
MRLIKQRQNNINLWEHMYFVQQYSGFYFL